MNVLLKGAHGQAPDEKIPDTIVSRTHGRILEIIKPGSGKSFDDQSRAIQSILEEVFQDADEAEELLVLKEAFIEDLTAKNDKLLERITEICKENDILTENHENLKKQFANLESTTLQLKKDVEGLQDKNQTYEKEYSELKENTEDLNSDCLDLKQKYEELEEQFDTLSKENETLKSRSTELEQESENLYCDYDRLDEEYKKFKDDSKALKQKYSELEAQYAELKDETEAWSSRYDELNEDYSKLQKIVEVALQGQKQGAKQLKGPADRITDKFGCPTPLNFVAERIWDTMPLPVHVLYQYGKQIYETYQ